MYFEIPLPKDIEMGQIVFLVKELDQWVIDYEFEPKKWLIKLITIPSNEKIIRELVKKHAKILVESRRNKVL
jgi:hypothetical protein